jgi:hypothetical protein
MKNYVKEYKGHKVPEGAKYYQEEKSGFMEAFFKTVDGQLMYSLPVDGIMWEADNLRMSDHVIELPEAKREPVVGKECEAAWLELPDGGSNDFRRVMIKGYFGDEVWFSKVNGVDRYDEVLRVTNCTFRPIKTQQEKDREAFIEDASRVMFNSDNKTFVNDISLGALFDAGFTAPKESK